MITAIETIRSVARHAVEKPPAPRAVPDRPPAGWLAGLPARAAAMLVRLFLADVSPDILGQALAAYVPLFALDWLPADPRAIPSPTARDEARIDLLRQERASRARLGKMGPLPSPGHGLRPDRPPEIRAVSALGRAMFVCPPPGEPRPEPDELWHELLDLTSETLETFIAYGHQAGIVRCAELLDLLADTFDDPRPAAA